MKIHYALYDPAFFTAGNYWTWGSSKIDSSLRNRLYDDVASKHLPPKPNDLQKSDCWAGLVRLTDWTVVYRYFNGGWYKYPAPRPQRYVLLTAWIPSSEAEGVDLLPILSNATFQFVAEHAETIPVPEPKALQERFTAAPISADIFQEGEKDYLTLQQAMKAFCGVPCSRKVKFAIAHLKIIETAREPQYVLNVEPEMKPEAKPQIEKPTIPQNNKPVKVKRRSWRSMILLFSGLLVVLVAVMMNLKIMYPPLPPISTGIKTRSIEPALSPLTSSVLDHIKDSFRKLTSQERRLLLQDLNDIDRELYMNEEHSPRNTSNYVPPPLEEKAISQPPPYKEPKSIFNRFLNISNWNKP